MKWITRSHVHVDRVACPWLITRFIDNEAEFLFVPKNQIEQVSKETGAIPFDAPAVELGHHEGRCSFESILVKYDLKDAGWQRSSMPRMSQKILTPIPSGAGWRQSHRVSVCASPKTWKIWNTNLESMTRCMPGAGYRL
jgi:hypothetical protein